MTQLELSPEVVDALTEAAKLRGLDVGQVLLEAIGIERQIARALDDGAEVLIAKKGKPTVQLMFTQQA